MKKMFSQIMVLSFFVMFFSITPAWGLNEETHRDINEFIGKHKTGFNDFLLDTYLREQLGFIEGQNEVLVKNFEGKKVFEWLGEGGFREDKPKKTAPYLRSTNHFHNPLKPLDEAGFSGVLNIPFLLPGESSIAWSQRSKGTQHIGGHYSWHDARDYFYKALTSDVNGMREVHFAETFRALGQLMHLIEDLSVPEHSRDDGHYADAYEDYVKERMKEKPEEYLAQFSPVFFEKSALNQASPFAQASVPIARMFDSNQYTGANPNITLQQDIGLAEYSNANFVSGDTLVEGGLFNTHFPYPALKSVTKENKDIDDVLSPGNTVKRSYYVKTADGDSDYRLAGVGYLTYYAEQENVEDDIAVLPPMDKYEFKDYAKKLLPRAIGYAAGLLNCCPELFVVSQCRPG